MCKPNGEKKKEPSNSDAVRFQHEKCWYRGAPIREYRMYYAQVAIAGVPSSLSLLFSALIVHLMLP